MTSPILSLLYRSNQCCIIRSVPAGTDGKSRTGMQTGTRQPHVPPQLKFRPVSACFARFGLFRPVPAGMSNPAGILFGFYFLGFHFQFSVSRYLISRSLLSFELRQSASTAPPAASMPPASAFKPSTSNKAASKPSTSLQAFNQLQPSSFACKFLVSPFQICRAVAVVVAA